MDKICWKGLVGASFSVHDAYKVLNPSPTTLFPAKGIWVTYVPTKPAFAWGKVLTLDKLQRRGWHFPNRCYLCGRTEESVHHILLHCSVVNSLWEIILSLVGVSWAFPKTVKEALLSWRGSFLGKKRMKILKSVPLCIFWTVWNERNHIAFRD